MITFVTKRATLMRSSTVPNLPVQLVFPGLTEQEIGLCLNLSSCHSDSFRFLPRGAVTLAQKQFRPKAIWPKSNLAQKQFCPKAISPKSNFAQKQFRLKAIWPESNLAQKQFRPKAISPKQRFPQAASNCLLFGHSFWPKVILSKSTFALQHLPKSAFGQTNFAQNKTAFAQSNFCLIQLLPKTKFGQNSFLTFAQNNFCPKQITFA
jgi:hypothetical protein